MSVRLHKKVSRSNVSLAHANAKQLLKQYTLMVHYYKKLEYIKVFFPIHYIFYLLILGNTIIYLGIC